MVAKVLISLENVSFNFSGKPLFEGLNLHINEGDRISLVGRNGAGKTTLMKLITGELEIDSGKRFCLPAIEIGYLAQKVDFDKESTVKDFVLSGLRPSLRTDDKQHLADIIIEPLYLDKNAKMGSLSGGQLRRSALAKSLIAEPDLLLLDEPTNHLDLTAIKWLENYLRSYRGALLCVSHDRAFLANTSEKVFWLDRGSVRVCPKGYAEFDDWSETIIEHETRELHNLQKKLESEEDWTQGGISARRKRNMRRMRELYKLREKIKSDKEALKARKRNMEIDDLEPSMVSKRIAEFKEVSKSYSPDKKILDKFSYLITKGDRIGILGKNGSGKSTFLKLLTSEIEPDSGKIYHAKNLEIAYFDQNRSRISPDKSVWEVLCPSGGEYIYLGTGEDRKAIHVCGYLKRFMFDPKSLRESVGILSGGQQNRLMLASVLINPGNLMILDEPTNDLDMDTLDMLQEILAEYQGTLIIVSHDRDFLDRTVTEVLAFEGDAVIESYLGGYTDYLAKKKAIKTSENSAKKNNPTTENGSISSAKPKAKLSYKIRFELEQLPINIENLEQQILEMKNAMSDSSFYTRSPEEFDLVAKNLVKAEDELEKLTARWLELEEMAGKSE